MKTRKVITTILLIALGVTLALALTTPDVWIAIIPLTVALVWVAKGLGE